MSSLFDDLDFQKKSHLAGARRVILEDHIDLELHQRFRFDDVRNMADPETKNLKGHRGSHPEIMIGIARAIKHETVMPFVNELCEWRESGAWRLCNLCDASCCTGGRHRSVAWHTLKARYAKDYSEDIFGGHNIGILMPPVT